MNDELKNKVDAANGKRRNRIITADDITTFEEIFAEMKDDPKIHTIRVYPRDAFVPNSYQWRCETSLIEASRDADGNWHIGSWTVDAKRSHGAGAKITINGRAY